MNNFSYKALIILLFVFGCSNEEETDHLVEYSVIEFTSFNILSNTDNLFQTETILNKGNFNFSSITNHGVELYYLDQIIERYDQGVLRTNKFKSEISNNMQKGFNYSIRPYVISGGNEFYGDFVYFDSNLSIEIEIDDIFPLTGFVGDTINVTGKNFCNSSFNNSNFLLLGGFYQDIVFNSDSLLKAIILPDANQSKADFKLESCKIIVASDFQFEFEPPQLDSISTQEYYPGEKSRVYCKNLHPRHTKIWLNGIEVEVNQERDSIVDLEFYIPDNLPPGKQDFKMQVIDRVLELKQAYQSTSPEISEIDKLRTGFLDTITIKGNYLIQPNETTTVSIGDQEQTIISESPNELKVLINQYFTTDEPKLKFKSGNFEIEKEIEMLPPEIISFDKEQYHLQDDVVRIKTKYFLGYASNINVANEDLYLHSPFEGVDEEGYVNIDLNYWLEIEHYSPDFVMDETGKIGLSISTAYGEDLKYFNIVAPSISSINKEEFYYGERIVIEGNNLGYSIGYRGISELYINEVKVPFSGNSDHSFKNQQIYLPMPDFAVIGSNTLRIVTGGQNSNTFNFDIVEVIPQQLSINAGTRKDIFQISGQNLYGEVYANDAYCEIIEISENVIQFQVPHYNLLTEPVNITLKYGPHTYDIGNINTIEPYEKIENFTRPNILSSYSHFEYMNEFYIVNDQGILKFNLNSGNWNIVESDFGDIESFSNERRYSFVAEEKVYFPSKKSFKVYNLATTQWENEVSLNITDDLDIWYASIHNDIAYIITSSSNTFKFYAYNLSSDVIIDLPQPKYFPNGVPNIFAIVNNYRQYDGRIYLELYGTIQMFDINSNLWTDIGHPTGYSYRQQTNLYEYNGILYSSGGLISSSSSFYDLYGYDINTGQWSEKTYMPSVLSQHSVYGYNNKLYFFLGNGIYSIDNQELFVYDIALDPH